MRLSKTSTRRMDRRWRVAETMRRFGWCWSDLVGWAIPPPSHRLRDVDRRSACAVDPDTLRAGSCYCGQVGPDRPRRWTLTRLHCFALGWVTALFMVAGAAQFVLWRTS